MKLFFSISVALLFFIGCSDKTTNNSAGSQESTESSTDSSNFARNTKPSCFVDKGFDNEIDCYEGEAEAMKERCESIKKQAISTESKLIYSEQSGCPTNRSYIGCCATVDSTQCYYLSDSYDTKERKEEWESSLKSDCISYGDKWEE